MSSAVLKINSANWELFVKRTTTPNSYTKNLLHAWAVIYLADMRRKFSAKSRGKGNWPAISKETERRKNSKLILIETGRLMKALSPGGAGNFIEFLLANMSVRVGFSDAMHSENVTYNDLAQWHNNGEGSNPTRQILEIPSPKVMRQMVRAARVQFNLMQADLRGSL